MSPMQWCPCTSVFTVTAEGAVWVMLKRYKLPVKLETASCCFWIIH